MTGTTRRAAPRLHQAVLSSPHPVPSEGRLQCSLRGAGAVAGIRSEATRRFWSRRPKPYGPVALCCASHEALAKRALFRANGGAPECLDQRWTRSREGPEKGESTGGFVEQAY